MRHRVTHRAHSFPWGLHKGQLSVFQLSHRLGRKPVAISISIALAAALLTILIGQQRVKAAGAWPPPADAAWHIALQGDPGGVIPGVSVYEVDLFDVSADQINARRNAGATVICYFSGGTHEDWRSDANQFPADAVGNALGDWPGERWLDISNLDAVGPVMANRIALAADKGCDAVDPDNVDSFTHNTGFDLTAEEQIRYVRYLADTAHNAGLMIGLKNALSIAPELAGDVDFSINESCQLWNECGMLKPFAELGKPIFAISYAGDSACSMTWSVPVHLVIKERSLFADPWKACTPPTDFAGPVTAPEPVIAIEPPIYEVPTTVAEVTQTTVVDPPSPGVSTPEVGITALPGVSTDGTPVPGVEEIATPVMEDEIGPGNEVTVETSTVELVTPDVPEVTVIDDTEAPVMEDEVAPDTEVTVETSTVETTDTDPQDVTVIDDTEAPVMEDEVAPDTEVTTETDTVEDVTSTTVAEDSAEEPVVPPMEDNQSETTEDTVVTSSPVVPKWQAAAQHLAQKFTDAVLARFTPEKIGEMQANQSAQIATIIKAIRGFLAAWVGMWLEVLTAPRR
ncbi:MAG: endo alpha-1,4 polygalactosaminidase [Acidimicrobiia bacterium]|nr:endo alpha-1,4 polygalactosaminidase [Acidimicrobiia bacterium]